MTCLSIGGSLALWECISRSGAVNPLLFPPPSAALIALRDLAAGGVLASDIGASLWRALAGLLIAVVLGIGAGLLTGRNRLADRLLSPPLELLRALPPVAVIPLVIVWLGIGDGAKLFSIALAAFFPMWVATHAGVKRVRPEFLWSAALLTRSRWKVTAEVVLPAALPFIMTGVRNAAALAFIMVFVSELAGASSGLGYRIAVAQLSYRVDQMVAGLAVLSLCAAATQWCCTRAADRSFPWLSHAA